jgi:hypothetical protein
VVVARLAFLGVSRAIAPGKWDYIAKLISPTLGRNDL